MLIFDKTRVTESFEYPVLASAMVTAEGQPLVSDYSSGQFTVKPAVATATDKFVGVSFSQQITPIAFPYYEQVIADSANPSSLSRANLYSGTVRAVGSTTGALTVVGVAPAAGEVQVNLINGTLTFNAAQNGETVTVSYRYTPTTVEELTVQGNITPGGTSSFVLNSSGVITKGEIYTSEFATTIDWSTAASSGWTVAVKNGLFTAYATAAAAVADSAVVVPDAVITYVPTTGFGIMGSGSNAVLGVKY